MALRQYATFGVGDMLLGVEVDRVQEVFKRQELTAVPHAPPSVRGLMNLRGQIVLAVDLRTRLGLSDDARNERSMNVVVRAGQEVVSLLVDRIGDVVEAESDRYEALPDTLQGPIRKLFRGTYKMDHRLMLVLDVDQALQLSV